MEKKNRKGLKNFQKLAKALCYKLSKSIENDFQSLYKEILGHQAKINYQNRTFSKKQQPPTQQIVDQQTQWRISKPNHRQKTFSNWFDVIVFKQQEAWHQLQQRVIQQSPIEQQEKLTQLQINFGNQFMPPSQVEKQSFMGKPNILFKEPVEKQERKKMQINYNAAAHKIQQIQKNNRYLCLQISLQIIKDHFIHCPKPYQQNIGSRAVTPNTGEAEKSFNLELTMKTRNSKKSLDRHDSLVYSNATSFGIKSVQNNISKPNKRDISSRQSQKSISRNSDAIGLVAIDRTSSRGDVDENDKGLSVGNCSDEENQNMSEHMKKQIRQQNKSRQQFQYFYQRKQKNECQNLIPSTQQQRYEVSTDKKNSQKSIYNSAIHQQDIYQVLTDQILQQKSRPNQNEKKQQINSNQKSFSIKKHKNKIISAHHKQPSIFQTQINTLESRISKIKEDKLLKKKKLQEELLKINQEINQLNRSQQFIEEKKELSNNKKIKINQNVFESRIKISENSQEKEKAAKLVKNLRSQKLSRQKNKRNQIRVIDKNLHEQIEELMKMKYFNEERVKQKKKLQIIERMKKQQMRKIQQQNQKKQSLHFLAKIRGQEPKINSNVNNPYDSKEKQLSPAANINSFPAEHQSPPIGRKQTQVSQTDQNQLNLSRKKAYSNKLKHFTILKNKPKKNDIYQQVLQ